jgi:hypothetical protein
MPVSMQLGFFAGLVVLVDVYFRLIMHHLIVSQCCGAAGIVCKCISHCHRLAFCISIGIDTVLWVHFAATPAR